jgi:acyl carrier protein
LIELPKRMPNKLKLELKEMLVETLMLDIAPEEISDADLLWGGDALGLDSVDALQFVVSLDKKFGLKIQSQDAAKEVLTSIATIAQAVEKSRSEENKT